MKEADVIIPVYKPTQKLLQLVDKLNKQTVTVHKIILMNTEKDFFEQFIHDMSASEDREVIQALEQFQTLIKSGRIQIEHITKQEFDHGYTRNMGVALSNSPFFVMMTDDAIPKDNMLLENLLAAFSDETIAMAYGRQLPSAGCGVIESYTREFNYPDESMIKSAKDLSTMGIKAFFASNVCAAYRREVFDKLGGFTNHTIFNEDMIFARGVLNAEYCIAYAADACVLHSHNYSGIEQLKRNFDLGVSHAVNPNIFSGLATESEGIRLVKKTCRYLLHIKKPWLIFKVVWQSGCKYIGYFLGKRYMHLPKAMTRRLSMNREYWKDKN